MVNRYSLWFLLVIITGSIQAYAEVTSGDNAPNISYKLTTSYYQASDDNDAADVNISGNYGPHVAWIGEYGDRDGFRQFRTGYEYSPDYGLVRPTFSVQLAGGGFVGGSINAEIGGDTFAVLGFGRTNLKTYYSLNFDPNDAITIGMGSRAIEHHELSLVQTFDDRLHTQQRITHFVWRYEPLDKQRITLDASYKTGMNSDNVFIHGYGLSVDYSYNRYFVRLARDEYANFAASDLTRFAVGLHF